MEVIVQIKMAPFYGPGTGCIICWKMNTVLHCVSVSVLVLVLAGPN